MEEFRKYWVGFNLVKGVGAVRLRALLEAFGDLQAAWNASKQDLQSVGLSAKLAENIIKLRTDISLDKVWEDIQAQSVEVLTWEDENYPSRLAECDNAPPVLYLCGEYQPEDEWAVAIVGTRRVTAYGRQVTEQIARTLAASGVTVVSGLARGVDAIAHQSAIDAGGRTLAVLGCGVDRIYPPEHRQLTEQVIS
ncbi:MAG: DNA-protecting protein DprA, partial [Chloroflexi bacterium]|nr:DNA-protecting protein DprA [Chloroflexota bacterium]